MSVFQRSDWSGGYPSYFSEHPYRAARQPTSSLGQRTLQVSLGRHTKKADTQAHTAHPAACKARQMDSFFQLTPWNPSPLVSTLTPPVWRTRNVPSHLKRSLPHRSLVHFFLWTRVLLLCACRSVRNRSLEPQFVDEPSSEELSALESLRHFFHENKVKSSAASQCSSVRKKNAVASRALRNCDVTSKPARTLWLTQ